MKRIQDILPERFINSEPAPREYAPVRYDLAYKTLGMHKSVDAAHKAAQWFLNDILHGQQDRKRWLLLFGRSGCGKSHLVEAVYATLKHHKRAGFAQKFNWGKLMEKLLDNEYPTLGEQLASANVLLLDDIGCDIIESAKYQSLALRKLYEIMEARLGKWTFFTSNLSPEQFGRLDERIASRFFRGNNTIVDMTGAGDYMLNLYKKSNQKI